MEILKELVEVVSKRKVRRVDVIGNPTNYTTKMKELYKGIIAGRIKTDTDAIDILYNNDNKMIANYKKLKNRLQHRIINSVLFIDVNQPHFKDNQRAYYTCQKGLSVVNILFGLNARIAAISIAERIIKRSIEFEFTEIVLSLSRKLSRHYGTLIGDLKKYEKFKNLTTKYLKIQNAEILAEQYYNELAKHNVKTKISSEKLKNLSERYSNELRSFSGIVNTNNFFLYSFSVFWLRSIFLNNPKETIQVCEEAIEQIKSKPIIPNNLLRIFYSRLFRIYVELNNFNKGEKVFKQALSFYDEGSTNWFILYRNYINLALKSKKYQKSYEVFHKTKFHKNFIKLPNRNQELWKTIEAYIYFLIQIGKIHEFEENLIQFRIYKFLNEVPIFSKDKKGVNIPILIIQFLFLLQQKKYDLVIDKVEALQAYCYRYLKKDDTFRSNCFIKMLLLLPKCNFHRVAVERKSQTLFNKLKSVPLEVARQSAEIEIVPYEDLWEIVLEMLEDKFHKAKKS